MKLAIIVTALAPYRIALFQELTRTGNSVTVMSMMHHGKENREWDLRQYEYSFTHRVLPGITIPRKSWPFPLCINFGVIPTLWRANADTVISSGGFSIANVAAFLYCRLRKKNFVNWSEFTLEDGSRTSAVKRLVRRMLSRYADGSIASSSSSKDAFIHFGATPEKVKVVLMPVDVALFHGQSSAFRGSSEYQAMRPNYPGPVIIAAGRLDDIKGYPELFRIYEQVVKARPDVTLLIAGNGPKRSEYEKLVHEKGWKRVHFLGFLEPMQLAHYMALADFSVFASLNDSFGAVIAEAMAAELPVISSVHAYATRDLVEDGITGFRFDPVNVDAASETVMRMVNMETSDRKKMGRNAYDKVRQHDCENAATTALSFIKQLAKITD
jgi:glycosyltransferase involved in cell wall biosynthesis